MSFLKMLKYAHLRNICWAVSRQFIFHSSFLDAVFHYFSTVFTTFIVSFFGSSHMVIKVIMV